jgi:hypothetical protein
MRMPEIVILGLVVGAIAMQHGRGRSLSPRQFDAGLARLVDRATIELVQDRLALDPLPVRVRAGSDLRGPVVRMEGDGLCLRVRLYHDAPPMPGGETGAMRLASLRFVESRGWVVRIEGGPVPARLLAWHIDVRARHQVSSPPGSATAIPWWDRAGH